MSFVSFDYLEELLKDRLPKDRFRHTMGVAHTAACLSMKHGENVDKAYLAGLLHDCAKQYKTDRQVGLAKDMNIDLSECELRCPQLIHAKTGAVMAKDVYGIDDVEILDAILTHTTGTPGMTLLQKILYVSDYIEPNRDKQPRLPEIRKAAFEDINEALFMILEDTVNYLNEKSPNSMDEATLKTYEYYHKEK